jgi:hypothetical protein
MKNVGNTERVIRAVVGIGVLAVGYYYSSFWGLLGLVPLGTAALGWCPMYSVCKFSSCQTRKLNS